MGLYNPVVTDNSAEYMAQAAAINADSMRQVGKDIGGAIASIGGSFSESIKDAHEGESAYGALQAMGQMYPALGKITSALDQLDPRTRHMAAREVLGNFGALSQFGIAGMRSEQAPALQAQRTADQRNLMYEREQLARERQMMNTPQTPPPITVPTGMRRFNTGGI